MFVPERFDPRLCTDVIYAFAGLNPDTLLLQPFDPWADIEHSNCNNRFIFVTLGRLTSVKGFTVKSFQSFMNDSRRSRDPECCWLSEVGLTVPVTNTLV